MIVNLFSRDRMFSITLPERVSGQYWISDTDDCECLRRVASIEGVHGQWRLQGSEALQLMCEGQETDTVVLQPEIQVISARYRSDNAPVQLLVEPSSRDRSLFRRYGVSADCRLNIGRGADNQIVFSNCFVSNHHACLIWEQGVWTITDTQSSNGTFVNRCRIATAPLKPGDMVYIMGMKLVVGNGFFAVNDPDGLVRVSAPAVWELERQKPQPSAGRLPAEPQGETFYCSPRFCQTVAREDLRIDAPPAPVRLDEIPLPLLLGPALTMGITAVLMGAIAVINLMNGTSNMLSAIPTIAMSVTMLCGTLLWPMLTKRHEKRRAHLAERNRQEKYCEYLTRVRGKIYEISTHQKSLLLANSPTPADCEARILNRSRDLWERSAEQDDFLHLRLGLGELPLQANIHYPEERFSLDDDPLTNELRRLEAEPKVLQDVPILCPVRENGVTGIVGPKEQTYPFLQGLVLQMAALHSYHELKLVFVIHPDALKQWSSVRWLPHTWSERADIRFLASDEVEVKTLFAWLEQELAERSEKKSQSDSSVPHYVLIAIDPDFAEKTSAFQRFLSAPAPSGFSCLVLAPTLRELPKECSMVVELTEAGGSLYDKKDLSGRRLAFRPDSVDAVDLERAAFSLANLETDTRLEQFPLPNTLTFLEMYGVGKVEHLNALSRWKENNPVSSLQVPVGASTNGELFYLDLHEKFHGPHGLVAGMTGSGKSEFIITYILSLAVNFHPDEVAFILIDYKGGGLAGAFENAETGVRLPHLAGTITNLDGAAVKRSLISIQSELRRRQSIFNEARRISGEGTIDIYKYQKMYRSGQVTRPVPHLFIISDEFAELKSQQPEFMEQLISAARIGRSLGVHLILATQKPSGVVDDQIWSNSRFRICLKVQERSDSMEMIKRPDAVQLTETGRFYLQVGFDEFFAQGQSAWCGAPYFPAEQVEKIADDRVTVLDHLGQILAEARPKNSRSNEPAGSQVVSIVRYLSELAAVEHVAARQLWLPPIPQAIYLDDLRVKYDVRPDLSELEPVIGEYDDPFNQTQGLLTLPFSREGNILVYGAAGGGKTTLLHTMLFGLLRDYDATRLNVYLLDLGEETLQAFAAAPQVGDVLLSGDGEKIPNLFKMLLSELSDRKKRFAHYDGDYRAYSSQTGNVVPHILVVIRNYSAFSEQFELLEEPLLQLTREGSKYGIYFLVTANAANSVRYRLTQNFTRILPLQLNDPGDYIVLLGGTDGVYPSRCKGRGIFKTDRVYEFQTAQLGPDPSQGFIRRFAQDLAQRTACRARPVPTLPEQVTWSFFEGTAHSDEIPVGVEKESLQVCRLDLTREAISLIAGQDLYEMDDVVHGLIQMLEHVGNASLTVLDANRMIRETAKPARCFQSNFEHPVQELFQEMVRRNNTYKTAQSRGEPVPVFDEQIYLVIGLQLILDSLDGEGRDQLVTLLEKAESAYAIRIVLCDSVKGLSECRSSAWYRRQVSGTDGVWVGNGICDQYIFSIGKISNALYAELPPHFGYVVHRGKPTLCKLLQPQEGGDGR